MVAAARDVRQAQLGVLVSGAGLLVRGVYRRVKFDNPPTFIEVQSAPGGDQGVGPRTWFRARYLDTLNHGTAQASGLLTAQGVACLCAVLLLRRVWRRYGWGYAVYTALVLAIPIIGTKGFMGTGRYILAGTPRRRVRPVVLATSTVLLLVLKALSGRAIEVS